MKASYYPQTDSFYLGLIDKAIEESEEVAPGTVLDFDAEGNVVGVEIYAGAASRVDLSKLRLERKPEKGSGAALSLDTTFLLRSMESPHS